MEPIVIVGAIVVIYCGYLTVTDEMRDWQRSKTAKKIKKTHGIRTRRRHVSISLSCPEGSVAARWPEPLRDSF